MNLKKSENVWVRSRTAPLHFDFLPFQISVVRHGRGKLPKRKVTVMILAVFFDVKLYWFKKDLFNTCTKGAGLGEKSSNKNID